MKKFLLTLAACAIAPICAAQSVPDLNITDVAINKLADRLQVDMKINPSDYNLKTNTQWVITPVLVSRAGTDSVAFKPFMVTGKNAWYYARRQGIEKEMPVLRAGKGVPVEYADKAAFQPWMNNSFFKMRAHKVSCCGEKPSDRTDDVPVAEINLNPPVFMADFAYVVPIKEERKDRKLSGRAYVNFIVNKTDIVPTYMNNTVELRKILNSIDSVRLNRDASVDTIRLTGYASPEGPYDNNVRLAKGRTEAVKQYVMNLYDFPAKVYFANSVPEDWEGLREYVAKSNLSDRDAILRFIDDDSQPIQTKNDRLRAKFPASYEFLLKNEYPWLRHTDYYIHYVIRQYTTLEEIREAYKNDPRNLSLNEFFILAKSYPRDSDEFYEVIDKAAVLYNTIPEANLNAANAAMARNELSRAERLLKGAGSSAEAEYARGVFHALSKDYDNAAARFRSARDAGFSPAVKALSDVETIAKTREQIKYYNK